MAETQDQTPSPLAINAAAAIWVLMLTYRSQPTDRVQRMIAIEVQRAMDGVTPKVTAGGSSHTQAMALCAMLTEIVAVLGFQPSIPVDHKTDLMNALTEFKHAFGIK